MKILLYLFQMKNLLPHQKVETLSTAQMKILKAVPREGEKIHQERIVHQKELPQQILIKVEKTIWSLNLKELQLLHLNWR